MTTIRFRRGTAAQWTAADPVLASGEPGFETDTGLVGVGDGSSAWGELPKILDEEHSAVRFAPRAAVQPADARRVTAFTIEPASYSDGRAKFELTSSNAEFASIKDPTLFFGYNAEVATGGGRANEPMFAFGFEGYYRATNWAGTGIQQDTMEWYLEYRNADRSIVDFRPIAVTLGRDNAAARWATVHVEIGTDASNAKSQFFVVGSSQTLGASSTRTLFRVTNNRISAYKQVAMNGHAINLITFPSGKNSHLFFITDDGGGNQTTHWYLANFGGDPNHYLWNHTHGRFHVKYVKGPTDVAALTQFQSSVQVDGNVGFYGTTPIAKQTGVPATAAGIHTALVNLGLIEA